MMRKKLAFGIIAVFVLILQIGCSAANNQKDINDVPSKQEETNISTSGQEDKQKTIDEFNTLTSGDAKLPEIINFIDKNISLVSRSEATTMIDKLEEIQKSTLPELDAQLNKNEAVQKMLSEEFTPDFDISKIDGIRSKDLKDFLTGIRDSGYKIDTAEGMYYIVINYEFYKKYSGYVPSDIKDYIDIMAIESNKAPAKDAAIVIGWDEVLKRALSQERFINSYANSVKANDIKQLYKRYATFIIYGANNTPLFSYSTKKLDPEVKKIYSDAIRNSGNSKLLWAVNEFMDVLKNNGYKLTDAVESFRVKTIKSMEQELNK